MLAAARAALASVILAFVLVSAAPIIARPVPPGKIVHVNGIDLHYLEKGAGEPLLLLHGFGACSAQWDGIAEELATKFRVITPDLPGHGWSTSHSHGYTHRQVADDIIALLDVLQIDRVRAIGTSSGSMILLHVATQQPSRVQSMVLIAPTTRFTPEARKIMEMVTWESISKDVRDRYRRCAARGDDQARTLVTQFHSFKDSYDDMNLTVSDLQKVTAPTLIIHGDRDAFFPVNIAVEIFQEIPKSQLWIVPGAGHDPLSEQNRGEFLRITQQFFSSREQR